MKYFSLLVALLLFGCTSVKQISHIQGKGLLINDDIYISEQFSRLIWEETTRITGVGGAIPEIRFLLHSPTFPVDVDVQGRMTIRSHYGSYFSRSDRAEVYFGDSIDAFRNPKEAQTFIYGVLAHEFLHKIYIARYKNNRTAQSDHCRMIESGDLKRIWKFIGEHEETDGSAEEFELSITDKACRGQ